MDYFGQSNSVNMPPHFFWGCLRLDHNSAVRADISRQNYSVCPRYWYVNAIFQCARCSETFCFSAAEQKHWYEELGFYVDSYAKTCLACRQDKRKQKSLRQVYDRGIESSLQSKDIDTKKQMADIIDAMYSCEADLPLGIHENRKRLAKQIRQITE